MLHIHVCQIPFKGLPHPQISSITGMLVDLLWGYNLIFVAYGIVLFWDWKTDLYSEDLQELLTPCLVIEPCGKEGKGHAPYLLRLFSRFQLLRRKKEMP